MLFQRWKLSSTLSLFYVPHTPHILLLQLLHFHLPDSNHCFCGFHHLLEKPVFLFPLLTLTTDFIVYCLPPVCFHCFLG